MGLIQVGLNHKTAPLAIREKLDFSKKRLFDALTMLKKEQCIQEVIILSTCNRMEIYAETTTEMEGIANIIEFLSRYHQLPRQGFVPYLYVFEEHDVAQHLFKVASSLDSMVVGEPQILGQIRDAYEAGLKAETTGPFLDNLFQKAFLVGKRVRSETWIARGAVSISFAAVELAKKIFGSLKGKTVLIIGAGEMSEETAKHLITNKVTTILATNRTYQKAVELAQRFKGQAIKFDQIHYVLTQADIVISSTSSPHLIINRDDILRLMQDRKNKPIFFIDIALPRDIDPDVASIDNVYLYNIDDLQQVVTSNLKQRQKEIAKCEVIIEQELKRFCDWLNFRELTPIIQALKDKIQGIRQDELKRFFLYHKSIQENEKRHIEAIADRLTARFLKEPVIALKKYTNARGATSQEINPNYGQALSELFGLKQS